MKKVASGIWNTVLALVAAAILAAVPSHALASEDWDFVVAPYLMVPWISGDASLGRIEGADVDVDPGDILDALQLGGMIQVEARHKSNFGVLLNYAFMSLGDGATGPQGFTDVDVDVFQGILEGYATYRLIEGANTLDVYAGARWWDISFDVDATTPLGARSFDRDEGWVDPVMGFRWSPRVAKNFRLLLQGDIGGFGVASDFTWSTRGGVLWDSSDTFSLALLYQALGVDYDTGTVGTPGRFAYDTITQGPFLGAVFRF